MRKNVFILLFCLFFIMVRGGAAETIYIVKAGDSLWEISQQYEVSLKRLIQSNPSIKKPDLIFPGQDIFIPDRIWNGREMPKESPVKNRLFSLINEVRIKNGLNHLQYDDSLSNAAQLKAVDMKKNGYIAHNSPTYGNANNMLKDLNISFYTVKESIGAGHYSADEIFSSWLDSSVNRAVVLNEEATHIGVGYTKGGIHGHYWTILIISR